MDEASAFFVGVVLAVIGTVLITESLRHDTEINRALSCMAAGNTVTQCQDILGIRAGN